MYTGNIAIVIDAVNGLEISAVRPDQGAMENGLTSSIVV